eukprot:532157-Alexandrium_andersonii.AAC.1
MRCVARILCELGTFGGASELWRSGYAVCDRSILVTRCDVTAVHGTAAMPLAPTNACRHGGRGAASIPSGRGTWQAPSAKAMDGQASKNEDE